jgi:hypothetical protein
LRVADAITVAMLLGSAITQNLLELLDRACVDHRDFSIPQARVALPGQ